MAKPKAKLAPKKPTPKTTKATKATKAPKAPKATKATKATTTKVASKAVGVNDLHEEKKPDAPPGAVATHARKLANQVRTDADVLSRAKVTPVDAVRLDALADALDAAQTSWDAAKDVQKQGAVARLRAPLRAGRDHLFDALRTFADEDETTQRALDGIAGVEGDEDLVTDTVRLLTLAHKHRKDLDGTDVTPERIEEIRGALAAFKAGRSGARDKDDTEQTTSQQESDTLRKARHARDRAFWELATLVRLVSRRGQYAFRNDKAKRARYNLYTSGSGSRTTAGGEPTGGGNPSS
jgi:hypothetical protein